MTGTCVALAYVPAIPVFANVTILVPLNCNAAPVVYVVALVPPCAIGNVPEVTCVAAIAIEVFVTALTRP